MNDKRFLTDSDKMNYLTDIFMRDLFLEHHTHIERLYEQTKSSCSMERKHFLYFLKNRLFELYKFRFNRIADFLVEFDIAEIKSVEFHEFVSKCTSDKISQKCDYITDWFNLPE